MRKVMGWGAALACLGVLTADAPVQSCGYGMPSPMRRFLDADCVVVGRVVGFEDQNLHALPHKGAPQDQEYRIAIVRVLHGLKGANGQDQIRVGTLPNQQLRSGQEVLLFLAEHFEEPFYLMRQQYEYAIGSDGNPAFAAEVAQYRRWARLWNDPVAGLKSPDPQDRLHTATLLVTHWRTYRPQAHRDDRKMGPVDAGLSRLVLEALAGADWKLGAADFQTNPTVVFQMLGASAKDGWTLPRPGTAPTFEAAARTWLRENTATFRVQAFLEK